MSLHVQLEQFEGPLGLLLYLIKKEEMDIYNIQIHKITAQYLEYIRTMKDLDIEGAGDFVAMAATLIHIKSKMLLPNYNEQGEVVETEDPRKELVQRLVEYQKYQEVSKKLYEKPLLGRDIFARGMKEEYEEGVEEIEIEENGLFQMISLYRNALRRLKKRIHKVIAKGQSVASRILEIKDRLLIGRQLEMRELIIKGEEGRTKLLITFLSVLELARLGFISVFQSETYGGIFIETKRQVERDVVARVQEYETPNPAGAGAPAMTLADLDFSNDTEVVPENLSLPSKVSESLTNSSEVQEGDLWVNFVSQVENSEVLLPNAPVIEDSASDLEILEAEIELGLISSEKTILEREREIVSLQGEASDLENEPIVEDKLTVEDELIADDELKVENELKFENPPTEIFAELPSHESPTDEFSLNPVKEYSFETIQDSVAVFEYQGSLDTNLSVVSKVQVAKSGDPEELLNATELLNADELLSATELVIAEESSIFEESSETKQMGSENDDISEDVGENYKIDNTGIQPTQLIGDEFFLRDEGEPSI